MKIEMGESLLQSYLKYVKKCVLAQTNWKTSTSWNIGKKEFEQVNFLFEKIHDCNEFSDVFKDVSLEQALKQAELDVVGINNGTVYMVEVAFHENGLQYGDCIETKDRVCKKLLRAYLLGCAYFPNYKYEIIFASPKVNPRTDKIIRKYFSALNEKFSINGTVTFKYIANDDFNEEILLPTIQISKSDSDSSELFLRSVRMLELFNMVKSYDLKNMAHHSSYKKLNQNNSVSEDMIKAEISKISRKLPSLFSNHNQYNSKILFAFLDLYEPSKGFVLYKDLEAATNIGNKFKSNFDQMKIISKKNHGKIFEQRDDRIYLWDKVENLVLEFYENYKKKK